MDIQNVWYDPFLFNSFYMFSKDLRLVKLIFFLFNVLIARVCIFEATTEEGFFFLIIYKEHTKYKENS